MAGRLGYRRLKRVKIGSEKREGRRRKSVLYGKDV